MFEGGFLGLDNITVIDRGEPNSDGAVLEQSDATGWMGMFCLNLMRIALELARDNPVYEGMASKFLQHYVYVAYAMKNMGGSDVQLFDGEDGFFYDVLRYPDGSSQTFRVRSLVGLIPLFAVERLELEWIEPFKEFTANLNWFLKNRRHLVDSVIHPLERPDGKTNYLLTIVDTAQLRRLLGHVYDEREFLSRYGIRSLSKLHEAQPFEWGGRRVAYEPASPTPQGAANGHGDVRGLEPVEAGSPLPHLDRGRAATATDETPGGATTIQVLGGGTTGLNRFEPAEITVAVGTTVIWEWADGAIGHNVVPDAGNTPAPSGGIVNGPTTYHYTFNVLGSYRYHCQAHGGINGAGMSGIVNVVERRALTRAWAGEHLTRPRMPGISRFPPPPSPRPTLARAPSAPPRAGPPARLGPPSRSTGGSAAPSRLRRSAPARA